MTHNIILYASSTIYSMHYLQLYAGKRVKEECRKRFNEFKGQKGKDSKRGERVKGLKG